MLRYPKSFLTHNYLAKKKNNLKKKKKKKKPALLSPSQEYSKIFQLGTK